MRYRQEHMFLDMDIDNFTFKICISYSNSYLIDKYSYVETRLSNHNFTQKVFFDEMHEPISERYLYISSFRKAHEQALIKFKKLILFQ